MDAYLYIGENSIRSDVAAKLTTDLQTNQIQIKEEQTNIQEERTGDKANQLNLLRE